MVQLDYRTRSIGSVRRVDPAAFFERELPQALSRYGPLAAEGARRLGLPALALDVAGRAWTLRPGAESLGIEAGSDGAELVAELGADAFSELIDEEKSTLGLLMPGRAKLVRGDSADFVAWDTPLRAALEGRPVYTPGSLTFEGFESGAPLALDQSFRPDDDPRALRHFLEQAGFVHVRGLFTPDEMARVSADMDAAAAAAEPGNDGTWWIRTRARGSVPTRLLEFQQASPTLRALFSDERYTRLGSLFGLGHRPGDSFGEHFDRISAEALMKPADAVEGANLADLPWHKDCARGGHSRHCCGLTVGVAVTPASRELGRLQVVAGSHRIHVPGSGLAPGLDLPIVPLDTEAGDVTLHTSCTLHMSVPPERSERRVVYSGFVLPARPGDAPAVDDERTRSERATIFQQSSRVLSEDAV